MPQHLPLELVKPARPDASQEPLIARASQCAGAMAWLPGVKKSRHFRERLQKLERGLDPVLAALDSDAATHSPAPEDQRWLRDNSGLLRSELAGLREAEDSLSQIAHVRRNGGEAEPRVLVVAEDLLAAIGDCFAEPEFTAYLRAFQKLVVLQLDELLAMPAALKLVLMEQLVRLAVPTPRQCGLATRAPSSSSIPVCIGSLQQLHMTPWEQLLEPLIVFDTVLRQDPAAAYARMDRESRDLYRNAVVKFASRSDCSEVEIAEMAVSLAREARHEGEHDPRLSLRQSHVGYYLIAEGREELYRRGDVRPSFPDRWRAWLRRHPNEFYLTGIELLTVVMIQAALWWGNFNSLWSSFLAALALLLPCSQSAVEVMNNLTSSLFQPQILPKLDFQEEVPEECTTVVVVPTLLLNENQVRQLIRGLEVRYVANRSANLYFALLTDLADSMEQPSEDDPLIELCGAMVQELNRKYRAEGAGRFAMFHRHRIYNPREGAWMGWERKRGKLLDFNKLILGEYDSFPYKAGNLSFLPRVRYVLTVDSDSEMPQGSAQRLIGTIAHPLCQAIVDVDRNIVTEGYGILQPRVGISVESAARSRLASIYSGRTGFDIYTRAVSDVYQDLYGEGTFVGKGIYEIATVHRVLDHRFPRNVILSHDLIEGAYARAGLVSDVEVIDHYPSHHSAYTRRKHRWLRGDWQIMEWLFSWVPDESGRRVSNPISLVSRWKILDNLRRSAVEPATLALFVFGWTVLPGQPLYWTLCALGILFLPAGLQLVIGLSHILEVAGAGIYASIKGRADSRNQGSRMLADSVTAAGAVWTAFVTGIVDELLTVAFLVHDALVATDAIWRSLYRRLISRQRLLEWETAAEAELGTGKRTQLDLYLACTPAIACALGVILFLGYRPAFWVALPLLILWAGSKLIALWLDRPARQPRNSVSRRDKEFLRELALRTWRYFAEFSTAEHNWLIPDTVQEEPAKVVARTSPTNIGFLLNARQTACEFGYLTIPEFVEQTRQTLNTLSRLKRYRGHFYNWYDTRQLAAVPPFFISTVDSGNLAASLMALASGCATLLAQPLLSPALLEGLRDIERALVEFQAIPHKRTSSPPKPDLEQLIVSACESAPAINADADRKADWLITQLRSRRKAIRTLLHDYMPWLLPEFQALPGVPRLEAGPAADQLSATIQRIQFELSSALSQGLMSPEESGKSQRLARLLARAQGFSRRLVNDLRALATDTEQWVAGMDFRFLLDKRRNLLSIGYEVDQERLHPACYDLLASEARIATFVAIAKGDIPQDVWFRMGRSHVPTFAGPALVSWAGSMFEYLMPAIWMASYRGTLLPVSMERAVRVQQRYGVQRGIPWGISESAYCELDEGNGYRYRAFGIPQLALQLEEEEADRVVVAPYATALALAVFPAASIKNMRRMAKHGWLGPYGFYEAVDFTPAHSGRFVKSWMAHHQGMSLLSVANLICGDAVRKWFHNDVRVEATELLLQERPVLRRVRKVWRLRPPELPKRAVGTDKDKLALAG
jgi:hypothetical protein